MKATSVGGGSLLGTVAVASPNTILPKFLNFFKHLFLRNFTAFPVCRAAENSAISHLSHPRQTIPISTGEQPWH